MEFLFGKPAAPIPEPEPRKPANANDDEELPVQAAPWDWDNPEDRREFIVRSRSGSVHSQQSAGSRHNVPPSVLARQGQFPPPQAYGDLVTMDMGVLPPAPGNLHSPGRAGSFRNAGPYIESASTPRGMAYERETDGVFAHHDDQKYPVGGEVGEKDSKDSSTGNEVKPGTIMEEHTLPQDVYSLALVAFEKNKPKKWSTVYTAVFTWMVQAMALAFVAWDMMGQISSKQECCDMTLGAPIQTAMVVRYGQGVALVLALFGDNDVITNEGVATLELVITGLFKKFDQGPADSMELHQWISRHFKRVLFISVLKFFIGFGILWAAMVIIVQSESIIDLFGNFAAIAFVTAFDNVVFGMCMMGYFGKQLKLMSHDVEHFKMTIASGHSKKMMLIKTIIFLAISMIIFGPFTVVVMEQASGHGVCDSLTVSFGSHLHGWTGVYEWTDEEWHDRRVVYKNRADPSYRVGYCAGEKRWVFHRSPDNPCTTNWFARSAQWGDRFNIVKAEGWQSFDQENGIVEVGQFGMDCNRCTQDSHCGTIGMSVRGYCNEDTQKCECETGWFGPQCEFLPPCALVSNLNFAEFKTKFMPLEHTPGKYTEAHARPVYYSEADDGDYYHLAIYDGAKWHITNSKMLFKDPATGEYKDEIRTLVELHEKLNDFHVWTNTDWSYIYTSEQSVAMGPDDVKRWYKRTWNGNLLVEGSMVCDACNPQSQDPDNCGFGTCNPETRTCVCQPGYRGSKCNIAPVEAEIEALRFQSSGVCYTCPAFGTMPLGLQDGVSCTALMNYPITWADDSTTQFSASTDTAVDFAFTRKTTTLCDTDIQRVNLPTTGKKTLIQTVKIDATTAIDQLLEPTCVETIPLTHADCFSGAAFEGKKLDWIWMKMRFLLDKKP